MLRFFIFLSFYLLSFFSFAEEKNAVLFNDNIPTVSDENSLGIATWQEITLQASQISILDEQNKILVRKALISLDNPDIYAEVLVFSNGTILLKRDKNYAAVPSIKNLENGKNDLAKNELKKLLGEIQNEGVVKGKILNPFIPAIDDNGSDAVIVDKDGGVLDKNSNTYLIIATADSKKDHCLFFYKALVEKSDLAQRVTGTFCFPQGEDNEKNDEEFSVIAENITFDDGDSNKTYIMDNLSKKLHDYWSQDDIEAPEVKILQGSFSKNKLFVSAQVQDKSPIGFIKINGERLKDADFKKIIKSNEDDKGVTSFNIYVTSDREIDQATITVGDKYGNSKTENIVSKSDSVPSNGVPVIIRTPKKNKTIVLLTAVDEYKLTGILPLLSPQKDVSLIKKTLASKSIGIPEDNIIVLTNPTKIDFMEKLKDIRENKLNYGDRFIIYFSGHGNDFGSDNKGYWAFSDTTNKPEKWLSNLEFKNFLAGFSDGGILLISDSCFSGGFIAKDFADDPKLIKYTYSKQARTVLTSGGNYPVPDKGGLYSAFAEALSKSFLEAVRKMKSKYKDKFDGDVPFYMVYDEVKKELARKKQQPYYGSFYQSDELLKDYIIKVNE